MSKCETCRWWGREREHDDDYPLGSCRRHGPVAPNGSAGWKPLPSASPEGTDPWANPVYVPAGFWPWVAFDDWCGEHEVSQ